MPSDAKLMQIAIDDLKNSSLSLEDRHRALQELLVLVEPIDNANGNWKPLTCLLNLVYICISVTAQKFCSFCYVVPGYSFK